MSKTIGKVVSVVLLAFLLVAIPLVGACAGEAETPKPKPTTTAPTTAAPTAPEVIEWKLLSFSPETSSCSQRMGKDFAEAVNAACGGRLVITPYYGASLVPEAEYLTAVKGGVAEMMMVCATYYVGTMPVTNFEYGFRAHTVLPATITPITKGLASVTFWSVLMPSTVFFGSVMPPTLVYPYCLQCPSIM